MRATGMAFAAGLGGIDTSGPETSTRGTPTPFIEPWPNAKPAPGLPMSPSMAASVMEAQ